MGARRGREGEHNAWSFDFNWLFTCVPIKLNSISEPIGWRYKLRQRWQQLSTLFCLINQRCHIAVWPSVKRLTFPITDSVWKKSFCFMSWAAPSVEFIVPCPTAYLQECDTISDTIKARYVAWSESNYRVFHSHASSIRALWIVVWYYIYSSFEWKS